MARKGKLIFVGLSAPYGRKRVKSMGKSLKKQGYNWAQKGTYVRKNRFGFYSLWGKR